MEKIVSKTKKIYTNDNFNSGSHAERMPTTPFKLKRSLFLQYDLRESSSKTFFKEVLTFALTIIQNMK